MFFVQKSYLENLFHLLVLSNWELITLLNHKQYRCVLLCNYYQGILSKSKSNQNIEYGVRTRGMLVTCAGQSLYWCLTTYLYIEATLIYFLYALWHYNRHFYIHTLYVVIKWHTKCSHTTLQLWALRTSTHYCQILQTLFMASQSTLQIAMHIIQRNEKQKVWHNFLRCIALSWHH